MTRQDPKESHKPLVSAEDIGSTDPSGARLFDESYAERAEELLQEEAPENRSDLESARIISAEEMREIRRKYLREQVD